MGQREDRTLEESVRTQDPTEEVGGEECNATAPEAEFQGGTLDEKPDGSHPKFSEELQDAYSPEPEKMVLDPIDGLPVPADENQADDTVFAPPFTFETMVCVEDDREYVEVFAEEDGVEELRRRIAFYKVSDGMGKPLQGAPTIAELRLKYLPNGTSVERKRFDPKEVIELWGLKFCKDDDGRLVMVRPLRERCIHYKRQVFSNDAVADYESQGGKIVFRNCMIRRSIGGAFLSLRDEGIFSCDYRSPHDHESTKRVLDDPDSNRLRSNAHKIKLPLFNFNQGS